MIHDGIESDLICGICRQILRDPYILPCDHSFCKSPCLLASPVQPQRTVSCPICFIEVDISEIFPNKELSTRLRDLYARPSTTNSHSLVQCSECHDLCPTLIHCAHCNSSICNSCLEKHLATVRNSVRSRTSCLNKLRHNLTTCRSDLATIRASAGGNDLLRAELTADIEETTERLNRACERSFERSMGDLTVEEMQGLERLSQLKRQLDDASTMHSLVVNQSIDLKSEDDTNYIVVYQQQASNVLEQVKRLVKSWSEVKDLDRFECWKVSKTFETIGDTLVSMNLVVCDVLQSTGFPARHFSSFQSYPERVLSSSDESVVSFTPKKKTWILDLPGTAEPFS